MSANDAKKALIYKIEDMRAELNELAATKDIGNPEVLKQSQKMDLMINKYLRGAW